MYDVLVAILPVFIIIGIGTCVDLRKFLPPATSSILNAYVLKLALPVLLLRIMADAKSEELPQPRFWLGLLGAQFLIYALAYAADRLLLQRGSGPAAVSAMASSSSMTAFVGLPVVISLLPDNREALIVAGLLAVVPTLNMTLAQVQLEIERQKQNPAATSGIAAVLARAILANPLVIGMVAGAILGMTGVGLWNPLDRAAVLVGNTSAPCVLIALGLDLREKMRAGLHGAGGFNIPHQVGIAFMKLVAHPLLTWAFLAWLGIGGVWLALCVIMSATGVAVGCYVVAGFYRTATEECAASVVATNALSLIAMPAFAYAFKALEMI